MESGQGVCWSRADMSLPFLQRRPLGGCHHRGWLRPCGESHSFCTRRGLRDHGEPVPEAVIHKCHASKAGAKPEETHAGWLACNVVCVQVNACPPMAPDARALFIDVAAFRRMPGDERRSYAFVSMRVSVCACGGVMVRRALCLLCL